MTINFGQIAATTKLSITTSDTEWADPSAPTSNPSGAAWIGTYIMQATADVLFDVNTPVDIDVSPRLPANQLCEIQLQQNDNIHFSTSSGTATVWITRKS